MKMRSSDPNKYYTFTMTDTNGKKVELSLSETEEGDMTLSELLEQFRGFLIMCDYHFETDEEITVAPRAKQFYDELIDSMVNHEDAEAKAYKDASGLQYPETLETIKWVDASDGKEYSSHPGFNYKPKDY